MSSFRKYYLIYFILNLTSTILCGQNRNDSIQKTFNCSCKLNNMEGQEIFSIVDKMPSYPDGEGNFLRLIHQNLILPDSIVEFQTKIYLTFVVDTLGNVTNKCIERPYYSDKLTKTEKAALESLDKMKNWIPGENSGRKVPVKFSLPIILELR